MYRDAVATDVMRHNEHEPTDSLEAGSQSTAEPPDRSDDLTSFFICLHNLPTWPHDRLSRYKATLWRQASLILFTLRCLERHKPQLAEDESARQLTRTVQLTPTCLMLQTSGRCPERTRFRKSS
jgi:hypothetical protein